MGKLVLAEAGFAEESMLLGEWMNSSQKWQILLALAPRGGSPEILLRRALNDAERAFGPDSPEAGLCLIDLADWLEQSGEYREAAVFTERYREILCRFAREMEIERRGRE